MQADNVYEKKPTRLINEQLIKAVEDGDLGKIKEYVENMHTDLRYEDERPLKAASYHGHYEIMEYLLSNGANPNGSNGLIMIFGAMNNLKQIKLLQSYGGDITNEEVLHKAIVSRKTKIVDYLLKNGAEIKDNVVIFKKVWRSESTAVMKVLLKNGLVINQECKEWISNFKNQKMQNVVEEYVANEVKKDFAKNFKKENTNKTLKM